MVLDEKMLACSLWVGGELLPQVEACINQRPAYSLLYSDSDLQSSQNKDPDIGLMLTWLGQGEAQHLQVPGGRLGQPQEAVDRV